jgi:hypothetical protein
MPPWPSGIIQPWCHRVRSEVGGCRIPHGIVASRQQASYKASRSLIRTSLRVVRTRRWSGMAEFWRHEASPEETLQASLRLDEAPAAVAGGAEVVAASNTGRVILNSMLLLHVCCYRCCLLCAVRCVCFARPRLHDSDMMAERMRIMLLLVFPAQPPLAGSSNPAWPRVLAPRK